MLNLRSLDLDEIATALEDQRSDEHRWLMDPATGEVTVWTADGGIDVPGDLAVIGADDIPVARLADPPLTTVLVDTHRFGQVLASHVVHGLTGEGVPERVTSAVLDVVVRESAERPRGAHLLTHSPRPRLTALM